MRTGVDALSYDFHYLDITEDSIYFGPIYNRQGFAIEEIQWVECVKTKKNRSFITFMATQGGLTGALVGGIKQPDKDDDCDEGCGFDLALPELSVEGALIGLTVGAAVVGTLAYFIESSGAHRRYDLSSKSVELRSKLIRNLKNRGWPASEKDLLR